MKNLIGIVLLIVVALSGCKKEEIMLSGDITGNVVLYSQNYIPLPSEPGIKVKLYSDSRLIDSTVTDGRSQFLFEDLTYGRYHVICSKEGFVRSWEKQTIFHVGGPGATCVYPVLQETPYYQLELDSIFYDAANDLLIIHVKIDGDTILTGNPYSYMLRVFVSNSPGVSSSDFSAIGRSIILNWDYDMGLVTPYVRLSEYDIYNFHLIDKLQPVYLILYPITMNQGYYPLDFFPESLGPPSNVISFTWDEVVNN